MGFSVEGNEHMVCKLKKSIYSLKQGSRQWYLKFNDIIISFGFKKNTVNQCIYLKVSRSKVIFLILYVDDILIATNDLGVLHKTKKFLSNNFDRDKNIHDGKVFNITFSQKVYINKVLKRFMMERCSALSFPI